MSSGKHVFEILWPWGGRGTHSTIGIGTEKACLKARGACRLVGCTQHSWGLDIVTRRVVHKKKIGKMCPTDGSYVPDRFFMLVDLDAGIVGFGNDASFWGFVIENIPKGSNPYYVMVGTCKYQADLQVHYRGSAGSGGFDIFSQPGPSTRASEMPSAPPPYVYPVLPGYEAAAGIKSVP